MAMLRDRFDTRINQPWEHTVYHDTGTIAGRATVPSLRRTPAVFASRSGDASRAPYVWGAWTNLPITALLVREHGEPNQVLSFQPGIICRQTGKYRITYRGQFDLHTDWWGIYFRIAVNAVGIPGTMCPWANTFDPQAVGATTIAEVANGQHMVVQYYVDLVGMPPALPAFGGRLHLCAELVGT